MGIPQPLTTSFQNLEQLIPRHFDHINPLILNCHFKRQLHKSVLYILRNRLVRRSGISSHIADFVFPELKKLDDLNDEFLVERIISENASRIDKFLSKFVAPTAGVTHKVTMHIARHTFGNIAGDNNIPLIMLQKIFRHSKITTTMAYMANFIHKDADDALSAVVG